MTDRETCKGLMRLALIRSGFAPRRATRLAAVIASQPDPEKFLRRLHAAWEASK